MENQAKEPSLLTKLLSKIRSHPIPYLVASVFLVLLLLSIAGWVYIASQSKDKPNTPAKHVATPSATPSATQPTESTKEKKTVPKEIVKDGVTWLQSWQRLGDLNLYKNFDQSEMDYVALEYYKVGSDSGRDIVLSGGHYLSGPPMHWTNLFLKTGPDKYEFLVDPHNVGEDASSTYELSPNVTTNESRVYESIMFRSEIVFNGIKLKGSSYYNYFSDYQKKEGSTLSDFGNTPYGELYLIKSPKGNGFSLQSFILKLPDQEALTYRDSLGFFGDDSVPQVTWNSGVANKDSYRHNGVLDCGATYGSIAIMDDSSTTGLTKAGKTKSGENIYDLSDPNNPVLKYFYDQYATDYQGGTNKDAISLDEFRAKHAVFIYRDGFGRNVIFTSLVYGLQAECAKPVIYLYPASPTNVSVKVGAKITASEPDYGQGWQVIALPDGTLYWQGKKFESLFWEGKGQVYPEVNSGFVIPQKNLLSTISQQLHDLGLNVKESSDFINFWSPKLPKTPFVRVSWLGTREMNALAPLTVDPKPDTMIRVFMDFEGLQSPIKITPQKLWAPIRKGFTLVEWGGLLIR